MNRYPLWKYAILVVALLVGLIYTLPNFFGEAPAVQVSSGKATLKIDAAFVPRVEQALVAARRQGRLRAVRRQLGARALRYHRQPDQGKDAIVKALNPDASDPSYIVALNLLSRSPQWLSALHALPMYLGLDLRGGVHFLMQVDMKAALTKKAEALTGDIRTLLRDKNLRHAGITRDGNNVDIRFRDRDTQAAARNLLADQLPDLAVDRGARWQRLQAVRRAQAGSCTRGAGDGAQAEHHDAAQPRQRTRRGRAGDPAAGLDRVVVQLPGVQDTAKAKDIIGRTATLEVRMVEDSTEAARLQWAAARCRSAPSATSSAAAAGLIVKRQVILTGENLVDAQAGFDSQTQEPDRQPDAGCQGRAHLPRRDARERRQAHGHPAVREGQGRGRHRAGDPQRDRRRPRADLRAHDHAWRPTTPRCCCVRRLAGRADGDHRGTHHRPEPGRREHRQGLQQRAVRLRRHRVFMCLYYLLFGVFSTLALAFNVLLLIAVLSMLQATLTLPGIAAIALALGMAIDANVLINERVREELRNGASPQVAINTGYERAWATILDSNVTTLIAGLALLAFGSGPVRGFASCTAWAS
jgi:preprotein translocase subunit SecD